MAHTHHHSHDHSHSVGNVNNAFLLGIVLNLIFVLAEVIAGLYTHSLSLLSDAGHNLADVASLGLSLLAFRLSKVRATKHFTYGYRKSSIIVALFNSVLLLVSIGAIGIEAFQRFFHPEPIEGNVIAIVAGIGIIINGATALLFMRDKEHDLNIKSAYLHMVADAAVSLAIVIGGIAIFYTNLYWIDSALSLIVAFIILLSSWRLLKSSLHLSLDAVPENINLEEIKNAVSKIPGVLSLKHIHIWAISTTENALTAHLVLKPETSRQTEHEIKLEIRHKLLHLNIHHATLETDGEEEPDDVDCV